MKKILFYSTIALICLLASCSEKPVEQEEPIPELPPILRYIEFEPDILAGPTGLSDNGEWVIGHSLHESFILNLTNEEVEYIDGIDLYDISDDGKTAYGQADSMRAAKYENGQIIILQSPTAKTGCFYSTTPDGSKAVGSIGSGPSQPVLYDNISGKYTSLEVSGIGLGGCDWKGTGIIEGGSPRQISNDGRYIVGSIVDDKYCTDLGCFWTEDTKLHRIDTSSSKFINDFEWFDIVYHGGIISPNGKYYVGSIERNTGYYDGSSFPYIYNTETKELTSLDASDFPGFNSVNADVVTDEGFILFSARTANGNMPHIYMPETGQILLYEYYLEATYNISIEPEMIGSLVDVSTDGRTILMGERLEEELGFITKIYTF